MSISLFQHNEEAYQAAVSMLSETGKAAIVHPTGTGKSFIGFKLCEDHPDSRVCWLSPSEYIFKTQLENLKAAGADEPRNISFLTYAKLMNMSSDEVMAIFPDYIILDEFHRCGAEMWGQGVQNLLKSYPSAKILGLSATAIRYLDNQRDMADELFDGNIASEMTIGEAIVRGILNLPKYVLSVFSYQKDLKKYERRVHRAKSKAVRDEAERYLEALRRALDKADGLGAVFAKHMDDPHGKYIVFCANYEHLCEMTEKVTEWFSKVDTDPHVYSAYSDDPETSKAFADFKEDNSEHGDLLPKVTGEYYHGVRLSRWIAQLRMFRKSGIQSSYLTAERIKMLDSIGMVWDVPDYLFEKNFSFLSRILSNAWRFGHSIQICSC